MRRKGLSNLALAKELKVAHTSVGDWLKEGATPRAKVAAKIADYFELPIETLLDDTKHLPAVTAELQRETEHHLRSAAASLKAFSPDSIASISVQLAKLTAAVQSLEKRIDDFEKKSPP